LHSCGKARRIYPCNNCGRKVMFRVTTEWWKYCPECREKRDVGIRSVEAGA
jgi:ribosomal protein L37AE/L43A